MKYCAKRQTDSGHFTRPPALEGCVNTEGVDAKFQPIDSRKRCVSFVKLEPLTRSLGGAVDGSRMAINNAGCMIGPLISAH